MQENLLDASSDAFDPALLAAKPVLVGDSFRRAYRDLLAAARSGGRLAILSGEEGSGRTTLLGYLVRGLPHADLSVITYPQRRFDGGPGQAGAAGRLSAGSTVLLPPGPDIGWREAREGVGRLVAQARQTVLALDDADALPTDVLREAMDLPAPSGEAPAAVTVILVASPTLAAAILSGAHAAATPIVHTQLRPLSSHEVEAYIVEALARVGQHLDGVFLPEAIDRLSRQSAGWPGVLNAIAGAALSLAAGRQLAIVTADVVDEAANRCKGGGAASTNGAALAGRSSPGTREPFAPFANGSERLDEVSAPSALPLQERANALEPSPSPAELVPLNPLVANAFPANDKPHREHPLPRSTIAYAAGAGLITAAAIAWQVLRVDPGGGLGVDLLRQWGSIAAEASRQLSLTLDQLRIPSSRGPGAATSQTAAPEEFATRKETSAVGAPSGPQTGGDAALPFEPGVLPSASGDRAPSSSAEVGATNTALIAPSKPLEPSAQTASAGGPAGVDAAPPAEAMSAPKAVPEPTASDTAHIASLIARGDDLLRLSDAASARLVYQYAVRKGSGRAMRLMGESYDPRVLRQLLVRGVTADPDQAIEWYQRAIAAGDDEAKRRLRDLLDALGRRGAAPTAVGSVPAGRDE